MFVPRFSLLLGLFACAPTPGPPLSRLVQGWATETAAFASDSMTGTLVLGALAGELCLRQTSDSFDSLVVGRPFPVSSALGEALGGPVVQSVQSESDGAVQVVLSDVRLAGRTGQWLRFNWSRQEDSFSVDYEPLVTEDGTDDEPTRMDRFGQIELMVQSDCTVDHSAIHGDAMWLDPENRRHDVRVPADQDLGAGLVFTHETSWLPLSGAIGWTAQLEGQRRTLTTKDATELRRLDDFAQWPVAVEGPDWSAETLTTIAP